jgi:hypothetical protein
VLIWNAAEHNDDENTRWCWLRAVEWINWPIFLSSSIVPLLLLFWKWQIVALILVGCNWTWYLLVVRRGRFVSVFLADIGVYAVKAKWVICPVVAAYFYYHGQTTASLISLLWPLFPFVAMIPGANLVALLVMPPSPIRPVQDRFMMALGYVPNYPIASTLASDRLRDLGCFERIREATESEGSQNATTKPPEPKQGRT